MSNISNKFPRASLHFKDLFILHENSLKISSHIFHQNSIIQIYSIKILPKTIVTKYLPTPTQKKVTHSHP